mmetsp:Transcript_39840/g.97913  ORF Transcript_39840/g.97913 Transcript_39840/m.97913 type:complete len:216 (+) Transcript_39840:611-1258(+)
MSLRHLPHRHPCAAPLRLRGQILPRGCLLLQEQLRACPPERAGPRLPPEGPAGPALLQDFGGECHGVGVVTLAVVHEGVVDAVDEPAQLAPELPGVETPAFPAAHIPLPRYDPAPVLRPRQRNVAPRTQVLAPARELQRVRLPLPARHPGRCTVAPSKKVSLRSSPPNPLLAARPAALAAAQRREMTRRTGCADDTPVRGLGPRSPGVESDTRPQ